MVNIGRRIHTGKINSRRTTSILDGLTAIQVSILEKTRKLMFNFHWSGEDGKNNFHLCSWEFLAKPKHLGGWGIKNLFLFNNSLVEKSLW
jgi:hypothetical protein